MPDSEQRDLAFQLVWSKQSDTDAVFHPATPAVWAAGIKSLRRTCAIIMSNSGDAEMKMSYQTANEDKEGSWDTPIELGSWQSTEGATYARSFSDISSNLTKRFVRFGYLVRNQTAGSKVETMLVRMVLDIRRD